MTHPDELLAEYVDGALSPEDRARIDDHLASCARCRGEVALSRHAVARLGRLSDRPAPEGVASAALQESRRTRRRAAAAARAPRWYRLAPVAAAAAVVLLLAIAIPRITASQTTSPQLAVARSESADTAAGTAPSASGVPQTNGPTALSGSGRFDGPAKGLEPQTTNYDGSSLQTLAAAPASFGRFASAGSFNAAKKCITSAEHGESGSLVRLIEAKYQDTPSYLAVFLPNGLQHQSAGSPVTIIVVTTSGCSLLAVGGGTT